MEIKGVEYYLYNGFHNSFIFFDGKELESKDIDIKESVKYYCDLYNLDGLIVTRKIKQNEIKIKIYNRDSSVAPMCGNGIRCAIRYAYERGWVNYNENLIVHTDTGLRDAIIISNHPFLTKVNLGKPSFNPILLDLDSNDEYFNKELDVDGKNIKISAIFMCTHHCVVISSCKGEFEEYAEKIEKHPLFKRGVNVDFVNIIDKDNIFVHTYERGVGWTLACGTGGCASFYVLNKLGLVNNKVCVNYIDGKMIAENVNDEVVMTGTADFDMYVSNN